jgi:hypothetical protein
MRRCEPIAEATKNAKAVEYNQRDRLSQAGGGRLRNAELSFLVETSRGFRLPIMLDARDARGKAKSLEAEKPSEIGKDAGFALGLI